MLSLTHLRMISWRCFSDRKVYWSTMSLMLRLTNLAASVMSASGLGGQFLTSYALARIVAPSRISRHATAPRLLIASSNRVEKRRILQANRVRRGYKRIRYRVRSGLRRRRPLQGGGITPLASPSFSPERVE